MVIKKTMLLVGMVLAFGFIFAACDNPVNNGPENDVPVNYDPGSNPDNVFVRVGAGTFTMGSPVDIGSTNERPTRNVTVSGFYMSRFPISQGEWYDVMGTNPSTFTGDNWRSLPVEGMAWIQVIEFANEMSRRANRTPAYTISGSNATWNSAANGYRLPTEAEWEFAARGGIVCDGNYTYSGGNVRSEVAWYSGHRERPGTHHVGRLAPNALGLYDMSGNVWEWVWDWYAPYPSADQTNPTGPAAGRSKVLRGGSWASTAGNLRLVVRDNIYPAFLGGTMGFRLVRP